MYSAYDAKPSLCVCDEMYSGQNVKMILFLVESVIFYESPKLGKTAIIKIITKSQNQLKEYYSDALGYSKLFLRQAPFFS